MRHCFIDPRISLVRKSCGLSDGQPVSQHPTPAQVADRASENVSIHHNSPPHYVDGHMPKPGSFTPISGVKFFPWFALLIESTRIL